MSNEYKKQWQRDNPDKVRAYKAKWKAKNPGTPKPTERSKQYQKAWRAQNLEKQKGYLKKWVSNNRDKINKMERERCAQNPSYRIARILRSRVRSVIKNQGAIKSAPTITLTGCDIRFLMGYLEARFKPGMKWSNYGSVWEIDHRVPCASFDLTDESHQQSCFHYSNLQPLFVTDNRQKHAKLPKPHQAELI